MSTVLWWFSREWTFFWGPLTWEAVAASALLLLGGLFLGVWIERKDIKWAAAYGRLIFRRLEAWIERRERTFGSLTVMITLVNTSAVLLIVVGAHLPPLSAILIVVAGINTGIMAELAGGSKAWLALLMPHSWIELPAVIVTSAAALEASAGAMGLNWFDILADVVWAKAIFLRACIPLLLAAAIFEAALIVNARRKL